jgi:hypothetical protein
MFILLPMHVMYCTLYVGFLNDDDRLHGSTLSYITLVVDALLLYD